MILILSKESDFSTDLVTDWLDKLGGSYMRLHAENIYPYIENLPLSSKLSEINLPDRSIKIADTNVIWYRRWEPYKNLEKINLDNSEIAKEISETQKEDRKLLNNFIFSLFSKGLWINPYDKGSVNKMQQLIEAENVGLLIPSSIISSSKNIVSAFYEKNQSIITKSFETNIDLTINNRFYTSYTSRLNKRDLDYLPETFAPSLFQAEIKKAFEVRSFYLDGKFYSMAIFSQYDKTTSVDFRKYNYSKPNRTMPFELPSDIKYKLKLLMKRLGLLTGSFDLIVTKENQYVFLEVNPSGQFGMVSEPCNYDLNKIIATYLIKKDNEKNLSRKNISRNAN